MERFYLKKLKNVESKDQYQNKISSRSADMENLDENVDIQQGLGKNEREYITISAKEDQVACELRQQKSWFDSAQNY
jgi:hypothetical protein